MSHLETDNPNERPDGESGLDPVVVCAADNAYVIPLAITLMTAADRLHPARSLIAYVVDTGIDESNWEGLRESLALKRIQLHRIEFETQPLSHLAVSHHISHAAYVRLLVARLLPASLTRVIYLDSDLIVRDDLSALWQLEFNNAYCLAVPDIACPFIDARYGAANYKRCAPYLAVPAPVRNWQSLGISPRARYFNSGVMVINLARWRDEMLADQFLACLNVNERYVWCWDQYALNVVLANKWNRLPMRWNVGSHVFEYRRPEDAPVGVDEFQSMLERPAIIHFTSEFKPWSFGSRHPLKQLYEAALRETAWPDFSPTPPANLWKQAWQDFMVALVKRSTHFWRKLQVSGRSFPLQSPIAGEENPLIEPASNATLESEKSPWQDWSLVSD